MFKNKLLKMQYYWHLFQQRHNELLMKDCLCEELKKELKVKAIYHHSKVIELFHRMNTACD